MKEALPVLLPTSSHLLLPATLGTRYYNLTKSKVNLDRPHMSVPKVRRLVSEDSVCEPQRSCSRALLYSPSPRCLPGLATNLPHWLVRNIGNQIERETMGLPSVPLNQPHRPAFWAHGCRNVSQTGRPRNTAPEDTGYFYYGETSLGKATRCIPSIPHPSWSFRKLILKPAGEEPSAWPVAGSARFCSLGAWGSWGSASASAV